MESYEFAHTSTVAQAQQIKLDLLALKRTNQAIRLDLSKVERIDTAVLQLIVGLRQDCKSENIPMTIIAGSERFIEACRFVGLDNLLIVEN
ncbi:STAS domain-containing protein [Catenovulum sediminis]|uniref:STAS domain-containing protein n=1 Tax=Catenovulum sediminis TaxID=1740262 RepID=A0ABV1RMG0_9ALTE|nr:STAS domain-containing protein [Catenovulum sediminis]